MPFLTPQQRAAIQAADAHLTAADLPGFWLLADTLRDAFKFVPQSSAWSGVIANVLGCVPDRFTPSEVFLALCDAGISPLGVRGSSDGADDSVEVTDCVSVQVVFDHVRAHRDCDEEGSAYGPKRTNLVHLVNDLRAFMEG